MSTHTITVTKTVVTDGPKSTVNLVIRGVEWAVTAMRIAREHGARKTDMPRKRKGCFVFSWETAAMMGQDTEKSFDEALAEFCEKTRQAHQDAWDRGAPSVQNTKGVECMHGKKYVRVVSTESLGTSRSAICFIDKEGNIWKPSSWKAPAKNFPRGNIFNLENHQFPPYGY